MELKKYASCVSFFKFLKHVFLRIKCSKFASKTPDSRDSRLRNEF